MGSVTGWDAGDGADLLPPTTMRPANALWTRPTVYRHFSTAEDLLAAAAEVALGGWTSRIAELTEGMTDAPELLVEAVAYLVERLPEEPLLVLLLETDRA